MRKLLLLLTILSTTLSIKANCDFSGITFKTVQQQGNSFYFQTNMQMDSCWYYTFTAYSYLNDKEYKLDNNGGWAAVTFNEKGKYEVRLNVFNECEKCDTVLTIDVDITIFGKIGYRYNVGAKNCKYYQFEMEDRKDSCTEYYYNIYKGDDYINGLTDKEWDDVDDSTLYFNYSWDEKYVEYYSKKSERTLTYEFSDSGRYLVLPILYNKCTQIDTWSFNKLNVCKKFKTSSVERIVPSLENITVIGYYDMMGRKVDHIEVNKLYIVLYSDGRRTKMMRIK